MCTTGPHHSWTGPKVSVPNMSFINAGVYLLLPVTKIGVYNIRYRGVPLFAPHPLHFDEVLALPNIYNKFQAISMEEASIFGKFAIS